MKRAVFAALALALAACKSSDLDPGIPLAPPPTGAITTPAKNVPAAIAAFSGTWHGKWQNGLEAILAVQTVARDGTATGTYSWGDLPGQFKAGSAAFTGKIAGSQLTIEMLPDAASASFAKQSDGVLAGAYSGLTHVAVLRASMYDGTHLAPLAPCP